MLSVYRLRHFLRLRKLTFVSFSHFAQEKMLSFGKPSKKNSVFTDLLPPKSHFSYLCSATLSFGIFQSSKIPTLAVWGFIEAKILSN